MKDLNELRDRLEDLFIEFDEFGFKPTILHPDPDAHARLWKECVVTKIELLFNLIEKTSKETALRFAERLKEKECWTDFGYDKMLADSIDEICKEFTGDEKKYA